MELSDPPERKLHKKRRNIGIWLGMTLYIIALILYWYGGYGWISFITLTVSVEAVILFLWGSWHWTKYKGLNPEAAYTTESRQDAENRQNLDMGIDVGAYPLTRMVLFGVNLQF